MFSNLSSPKFKSQLHTSRRLQTRIIGTDVASDRDDTGIIAVSFRRSTAALTLGRILVFTASAGAEVDACNELCLKVESPAARLMQ